MILLQCTKEKEHMSAGQRKDLSLLTAAHAHLLLPDGDGGKA